jgi:hypothetical protein
MRRHTLAQCGDSLEGSQPLQALATVVMLFPFVLRQIQEAQR